MKDHYKSCALLIGGSVIICVLFFLIRSLDLIFFSAYKVSSEGFSTTQIEASSLAFQGFRDFVTVITGLLTLIIGAVGIGAYLSFKKFREEQRVIISELREEANKAKEVRNFQETYSKIQEALIFINSESNASSAVEVLKNADVNCKDNYMLYKVTGDAFYFRGQNGDYGIAISNYEKALGMKEDCSGAWFRLGQAVFRSVQTASIDRKFEDIDIDKFKTFILSNNQMSISSPEKVRESIEHINKAASYGWSMAEVGVELGHMYKALNDNEQALKQYKETYDNNNLYTTCGFFYCHLWLREAQTKNGANSTSTIVERLNNTSDKSVIIKILNEVAIFDSNNSKAAYALLWFIYKLLGEEDKAQKAFATTNQYIINDLFEMKDSPKE